MRIVSGEVRLESVDALLSAIATIEEETGSVIQAIDARYVAGEQHLQRAVAIAQRERQRGEAIVDDPGMEILLYLAGTRQIDRALTLGVGPETKAVVLVVVGGNEDQAVKSLEAIVDEHPFPVPDEAAIMDWFQITDRERKVATASLEDLVIERVALLTVER